MAAGALTVKLAEFADLSGGLSPMGDRVIVLQDEKAEESRGGIVIPETAKPKPLFGTVVAVGPGRREGRDLLPMRLEVGDRIVFGFHSGHDLPEEFGPRLLIMREDEVLATR